MNLNSNNIATSILVLGLLLPSISQTCGQETTTAPPAKKQLTPEAQVAARQGMDFIKSKEFKKAIQVFKYAVQIHPNQGQLRHMLGYAYVQDKQLGQAWFQFRQAVRLNPAYTQATRDFLTLWQAFEKQGIFHTGRSQEEIAKLLGKPDSKQTTPGGEVWQYGFKQLHFMSGRLSAAIDPRGLTPEIRSVDDNLEIEFDDKTRWRIGYRTIDRIQSLTEYVPRDVSVAKWTELYTIQRLHGLARKKTPAEMMTTIEENLKKSNPNVEFKVLVDGDKDVMFHWRDVGSGDQKRLPQHEIVRLIAGNRDIHRLAYAQRVAQIPPETAKNWANVLGAATLAPVAIQPVAE